MSEVNEAYRDRLRAIDWEIRPVSLECAGRLVRKYHYAHGHSNSATYLHGLFRRASFWEEDCAGVTWWIPPTKHAALATYPPNWQGVLSLSRMVVLPDIPKNACSFLLSKSMKLIDRKRWLCLVTYADEWQGHQGTIYRATNWTEVGRTAASPVFLKGDRMLARKAGPKTRTMAQMEALGASKIGYFVKRKFVHFATRQGLS